MTADVGPDLWQLGARPESLRDAARLWRELGTGVGRTADGVRAAALDLLDDWAGPSAEAYRPHQDRVVGAYTALAEVCGHLAGLMESGAEVLATAQAHLDDAWSRLLRRLPNRAPSDGLIGHDPSDAAEAAAVAAGIREAVAIRAEADDRLAALRAGVDQARGDLWTHTELAHRAATAEAWPAPPELSQAGLIINTGDRVIVNATGSDDTINIRVDPDSGEQVVIIGGVRYRFPAGADLVVRTGAGNDTITVDPGARVRVTLLGGGGDDHITGGGGEETVLGLSGRDTVDGGDGSDRLLGGSDRDYLNGQAGDDLVVGAAGDDTLYGLDGTDRVWGGSGRDYLDGGSGVDRLAGGDSDDALFGGRDGDVLLGGAGSDALYGGGGTDLIHGGCTHGGGRHGSETDRSFSQPDDLVRAIGRDVTVQLADAGAFIQIEGSAEFVSRVRSDLDALRSSPHGGEMLASLQASHAQSQSGLPALGGLLGDRNTLVIRETAAANGFATRADLPFGPVDAVIGYNPTFDDLGIDPPVPPVVVLYHELAHVYDQFYGTVAEGRYDGRENPGVPNLEREATGLPIDHDADPATPVRLHPGHPFALTENGLRQELGLDRRRRY